MKHTKFHRHLLCLVLAVLLAAAALTCTGCTNNPPAEIPSDGAAVLELGEGETSFRFDVNYPDGTTASYTVHTDAETVGAALLANGLIDGEEGEFGLYVTTVGGQTLDWDADGMYWAFYENGEYAVSGVDTTAVTDGASYSFVATEG